MALNFNIQQIAAPLNRSKRIAGVEYLQDGPQSYWQLVVLERKGQKADFVEQRTDLESWKAVQEIIGKDTPVFLALNSRVVIHRKLEQLSGSDQNAIQSVFPNASLDDFYMQRLVVAGGEIISVARKTASNEVLEEAKKAGLNILHLSLGPFAVGNLLEVLPLMDSLALNTHVISIENQQISDFQTAKPSKEQQIKIGEETINQALLTAAALAFMGISDLAAEGVETEAIQANQSEFLYKKLFQTLGIGVLAFFFIALFANYLWLNNLEKKNEQLSTQLAQKKYLITQRDTLRSSLAKKTDLFGESSLGQVTKVSFYADQIGASLPSSIQLTELNIFSKIKEKTPSAEPTIPRFERNIIRIKGRVSGSVFYNNWKKAVEELHWVDKIHNISYQDLDEDVAAFELEIRIKSKS